MSFYTARIPGKKKLKDTTRRIVTLFFYYTTEKIALYKKELIHPREHMRE